MTEKRTQKSNQPDAMEAAVRYLEHRARTEQEVREKLRGGEYAEQEIETCIMRLKELHYIDDQEYALSYLRRSLEKRRGRLRVFRELKERGIERETVQQAIYQYEDEEEADLAAIERQNAFAEAAVILQGTHPSEKEKARAGRRLASLGYETSLIYACLRTGGEEGGYE